MFGLNGTLTVAMALVATPLFAQDIVKIGFASPLTGGQASYGKDNQNGAQMAIDELNAQGLKIGGRAVKFELMAEDELPVLDKLHQLDLVAAERAKKVSDEDMATLAIQWDDFHGEWNYTLSPRPSST